MNSFLDRHAYTDGSVVGRDATIAAGHAGADARRALQVHEELERRVERLSLMTEALWTLLRERLGLTDEELANMAQEIDLSDGKLDGRVNRTSSACTSCDRMVSARHVKCIYCGTAVPRAPFTGA